MAEFRFPFRTIVAAIPLIAFRAMAGGLPILIGLFIAHRWGLLELASYTVASATLAVALIVADWGGTRALPRELARLSRGAAVEMIASANAFRVLLLVVMLTVAAVAAWTGRVHHQVAIYLFILAPLSVTSVLTTNAVSERVVTGQTLGIAAGVTSGLIAFALLGGAVLVLHRGAPLFVAAYVASKVVEAAVIIAGRSWVTALRWQKVAVTGAALWPFSMQMILGVIYSRLSVFTVERMTSRAELGVFSVANALNSTVILIPATMALMHFPDLTRRAMEEGGRGIQRILVRYALVSVLGVLTGLIILTALSAQLARILKVPPAYVPFVLAFPAVALLSVFSVMAGFLMQARGEERMAARLSVVTLLFALLYQVVALRALGLWGIVPAVAAAEATTILIFSLALWRTRPGRDREP